MIDSGPDSRAGRTATEVVFAADLGGTNLRAATVDGNGKIHFRLKQNTPQAEKPDEILRALVSAVAQCKEQSKAAGNCIRAAPLSSPPTLNIHPAPLLKAP